MATSEFINITKYSNSTRSTPSSASSYEAYTFTFNKFSGTSDIIVRATIPVRAGSNGNYSYVDIGGTKRRTGIVKTYYGGEHFIKINQVWSSLPSGTNTIKFGWLTNNGNADQHWSVLHPNSSDDTRNRQTGSNWTIFEVSGIQGQPLASDYGSTSNNAAPSALDIKTYNSSASDGLYWIKPPGYEGSPFQVYCDMTTAGGGWMHVGTISDANEASNNASNHPWGANLNDFQVGGLWEGSGTLGSQSFTSDFKSLAWVHCPMSQFLIKDSGSSLRNLCYTNPGQISYCRSFSNFWATLWWAALGSENSNSSYNNGRVRGVSITNFGINDPALGTGNKSVLLLKFGESDGQQDGNKDRSMIAWHRHDQGDNVDAPQGLGCFTNRSGTIDYRDIVPNANNADFPPNSISGAPLNYTLWVR